MGRGGTGSADCSAHLVWQAQNQWIAVRFTLTIHARDISIGSTSLVSYLTGQLYVNTNIAAIPLWVIGFWYYARRPEGRRYRALAWMAPAPFVLFLVSQGRYYYPAAIYPMLIAAGSCQIEHKRESQSGQSHARLRSWYYGALVVISLLLMAVALPLAPANSVLGKVETAANSEYLVEIGWPDLVQTIAGIHSSLPASEQVEVRILAGSFGEAAAVNLYGPAYGLPTAISGMDSYWLRGYGDPPPQTLIVTGFTQQSLPQIFEKFQTCQLAGHDTNPYGIIRPLPGDSGEVRSNPDIFICRNLRQPWPEFWKNFLYFG